MSLHFAGIVIDAHRNELVLIEMEDLDIEVPNFTRRPKAHRVQVCKKIALAGGRTGNARGLVRKHVYCRVLATLSGEHLYFHVCFHDPIFGGAPELPHFGGTPELPHFGGTPQMTSFLGVP